jgi:hypothetical protein
MRRTGNNVTNRNPGNIILLIRNRFSENFIAVSSVLGSDQAFCAVSPERFQMY